MKHFRRVRVQEWIWVHLKRENLIKVENRETRNWNRIYPWFLKSVYEQFEWEVRVKSTHVNNIYEQYPWTILHKRKKSVKGEAKEHSGQRASINVGKNVERHLSARSLEPRHKRAKRAPDWSQTHSFQI